MNKEGDNDTVIYVYKDLKNCNGFVSLLFSYLYSLYIKIL